MLTDHLKNKLIEELDVFTRYVVSGLAEIKLLPPNPDINEYSTPVYTIQRSQNFALRVSCAGSDLLDVFGIKIDSANQSVWLRDSFILFQGMKASEEKPLADVALKDLIVWLQDLGKI